MTEERFSIAVPVRKIPVGLEEKVDKMVEDLLPKNIIRESESLRKAPLVCITKENSEMRLCLLSATKYSNVETDTPEVSQLSTLLKDQKSLVF